uniref:Uncharacterized protein n=1 Tax=Plectus sambesii TaxID=2011161 RepID=A0A914W736_9BILA
MWRSNDLISSDRITFLARFLAIIVLLWTEASASESGNTVHKRQVSWNRGYGGYGGYGYYPWNNGANGYYAKSVSFPGTQTGGAFNGIVGSQNGYGPNVWDRNTGAGNINNVGGMVGVGNQYLVNVAGGSFAGPRYGYGYGYGYGYPNGQNSPYGSFGYGGYGQNIYPSPSTYSNNACSLCDRFNSRRSNTINNSISIKICTNDDIFCNDYIDASASIRDIILSIENC